MIRAPVILLQVTIWLATAAHCVAQLRGGESGAAGSLHSASFQSIALAGELRHLVYLPNGYASSGAGRFTAVYLLHGRGGSMEAWRQIHTELDRMIAAGKIPPIIAIMPDAPSIQRAGYYVDSQFADGARVETAFTQELIAHVDASYRTQAHRRGRIVAGYSMGGYGALRFGLVHPELFGAAIVLSPAVYVPLPPRASSAREFGAFGRGSVRFDEAIYREKNYPAVLPAFEVARLPLAMFIAVGDQEQALPNPAEASHDLDYEAHTLYNRVRRVPGITARLRVLDGGHGWEVWRPALTEGLVFAFAQLGAARD